MLALRKLARSWSINEFYIGRDKMSGPHVAEFWSSNRLGLQAVADYLDSEGVLVDKPTYAYGQTEICMEAKVRCKTVLSGVHITT